MKKLFGIQLLILFVYENICYTLWISYFNVRRWAAEGHGDFLEAGVKGQLPSVADPTEVISGQQVDLRGLHRLFYPFQNLQQWEENVKNAGVTDHLYCGKCTTGLFYRLVETQKGFETLVFVKGRCYSFLNMFNLPHTLM